MAHRAVRRSTVEVMFLADASVLQSSFFKDAGYPVGTRDRSDLSYQRPLSIDAPAPKPFLIIKHRDAALTWPLSEFDQIRKPVGRRRWLCTTVGDG